MSLSSLRIRLSDVYDAILSFDAQFTFPQPPVISHDRENTEALPGLRLLREEVKRDCDALHRLPDEHASSAVPSTNAPYLIAVWDELVHAHQPIALYRTFFPVSGQVKGGGQGTTRPASKDQTRAVKVDVVTENGAKWVRVNTIKNTRLIMEFREIDSYLTSDDDDDDNDDLRYHRTRAGFDNSVLRMGRELLAAAKANPVPVPTPFPNGVSNDFLSTASIVNPMMTPQITMRLTRLDPSLKDDARIEKTISSLRDMGIDVELGERSHSHPVTTPKTPTKRKLLEPTRNINLDLSALIALVSDISHSSLPRTEQEARARFDPPQSYLDWKKDGVKSCHEENEDTWENSGQHSRALAAQAVQEMNQGLLEEIHERISAVVMDSLEPTMGVTFWTTSEARYRCLQIVSKIGGVKEKRRADALLGSTYCSRTPPVHASTHVDMNSDRVARIGGMLEGPSGMNGAEENVRADAYWEYSRYPLGFLPLVPVRVYASTLPTLETDGGLSRTSFFDALAQTCTGILSRAATPVQFSAPLDHLPTNEQVLEEILLPATHTSVPKLTVHTVTSMLAGVSRGYTTLTTNKSSVKAVLKEMRRACGGSGYEHEMRDVEKAAVWVVDPRSLSEGMRSE